MDLGKEVSSTLHSDVYHNLFIKVYLKKLASIEEDLNDSIFLKMNIRNYEQYGFN